MKDSLRLLQTIDAHDDRIWAISWHYSGKLVATCSSDKTARIWSLNESGEWSCSYVLSGDFSRTVRSLAWSPCGNYLAGASFDATVCIWKKVNNTPLEFARLTTLEGHSNEVKCVAWSVTGQYLATSGRDKSVWIWQTDEDEDFQCCSVLQTHTQDVKCVEWHPTEEILVSGSYDNTIHVYKESHDDWEVTCKLSGHKSTVWRVRFHPGGYLFASVSDDATIRLWIPKDSSSLTSWLCASTIQGIHSMTIFDCDWTVIDGLSYLAAGSADNTVSILSVESENGTDLFTRQTLSEIRYSPVMTNHPAHAVDVNCLAWRREIHSNENSINQSNILMTACDDGQIRVWDFHPDFMP